MDFRTSILVEKQALLNRLVGLEHYIQSGHYCCDDELKLLVQQKIIMQEYVFVLDQRLKIEDAKTIKKLQCKCEVSCSCDCHKNKCSCKGC